MSIYDGTGKVNRVQTWRDGVIQKEDPGASDWGSGSEVSFKDGKKHGEERILGPAAGYDPYRRDQNPSPSRRVLRRTAGPLPLMGAGGGG